MWLVGLHSAYRALLEGMYGMACPLLFILSFGNWPESHGWVKFSEVRGLGRTLRRHACWKTNTLSLTKLLG
jgi:hypothetical protein